MFWNCLIFVEWMLVMNISLMVSLMFCWCSFCLLNCLMSVIRLLLVCIVLIMFGLVVVVLVRKVVKLLLGNGVVMDVLIVLLLVLIVVVNDLFMFCLNV